MICPNCRHSQSNENAKFCEDCGTPLLKTTGEGQQANAYLENAKQASRMYFKFFASALKSPAAYAKGVGREQFINGIITIVLYSLVVPLIIYFGFHRLAGWIDYPFLDLVLRPALAFAIMSILTVAYCFLAIKYGKGKGNFQEVAARFGVYLVPFTALLLLALLMAILQVNMLQSLLLMVGLFGAMFAVPAFVISSLMPEEGGMFDRLQSTILVYIASSITVGLLGNVLFGRIGRLLGDGMSLFY